MTPLDGKAAAIPSVTLNDDHTMPIIGLGVAELSDAETEQAVSAALEAGYRSIDTASAYGNEAAVGRALASSGLPREELFITTKLATSDQGFQSSQDALKASLERLGLDYVDLYLIHWPSPHRGKYVETWKALVRLKEEGRARSVGVSNFMPEHLDRIVGETGVAPALNQIELHPRFQQRALREANARHGVATESWSPLGQGRLLQDPTLAGIAARHGKSVAQVIIRWHLDSGLIVIPKSVNPGRIRENFDVFDFALDEADLAAVAALDSPDGRIGPNPMTAGF